MTHLALQHHPDPCEASCALCARPVSLAAGPRLVVVETGCPVCCSCGRQSAPALAALAGLASAAERVGRINRHTVSPPMSALLELARAAESYAGTLPPAGRGYGSRPVRATRLLAKAATDLALFSPFCLSVTALPVAPASALTGWES